ncbi:hypothetical protein VTL71DRAFT_973 [Oculimacula yallundae]|uniref:BD-FAE-like domain-containing protein n=1 Tax=Oculimacula yallundae TaxID=86028 RepID=A0ABR4D1J0_9HELO
MDQIRALHLSSGDAIQAVLPPTFAIFTPLLLSNLAAIKSTPFTTHSYGSHPRQTLDIYPSNSPSSSSSPILIFFHGGGLIKGDKNLPHIANGGLVYANLGAFFAQRGVTTVVPNYRRVDFEGEGEGARWPSGGEDVKYVMEWVDGWVKGEGGEGGKGGREVFLCGNSAGGVHVSTFLLADMFREERKRYVDGDERGEGKGVVLKGIVELATPCHFHGAEEGRKVVMETYFGGGEDIKEKSVCGLLESVRKSGKARKELGIPERMYVAVGEFDPDDEIADSVKNFVEGWKETFGEEGLVVKFMEGHNHISPALALMSGDRKGENWAEELIEWMKKS